MSCWKLWHGQRHKLSWGLNLWALCSPGLLHLHVTRLSHYIHLHGVLHWEESWGWRNCSSLAELQLCKLCFLFRVLAGGKKNKNFSVSRGVLNPSGRSGASCPALQQRRTARNRYKLWAAGTSKRKWGSGKLGSPATMSVLYMYSNSCINKCPWLFKVFLIWKQMLCLVRHVPQLPHRTTQNRKNPGETVI